MSKLKGEGASWKSPMMMSRCRNSKKVVGKNLSLSTLLILTVESQVHVVVLVKNNKLKEFHLGLINRKNFITGL